MAGEAIVGQAACATDVGDHNARYAIRRVGWEVCSLGMGCPNGLLRLR